MGTGCVAEISTEGPGGVTSAECIGPTKGAGGETPVGGGVCVRVHSEASNQYGKENQQSLQRARGLYWRWLPQHWQPVVQKCTAWARVISEASVSPAQGPCGV